MHPIEEFFAKNYSNLRRYAMKVAKMNQYEAEEALHNTILSMLNRKDELLKVPRIKQPVNGLHPKYVCDYIRFEIKNIYKTANHRNQLTAKYLHTVDTSTNKWPDPFIMKEIEIMIAALPEDKKQIVDMRISLDMTCNDIAKELNCSLAKVKGAFFRTNTLMATHLNKKFNLNKVIPMQYVIRPLQQERFEESVHQYKLRNPNSIS